MFLVSSCSCLYPIRWSQVLSWEWRCSWSSADRRCSNYIWLINNLIAYQSASYIRDLTVVRIVIQTLNWKENKSVKTIFHSSRLVKLNANVVTERKKKVLWFEISHIYQLVKWTWASSTHHDKKVNFWDVAGIHAFLMTIFIVHVKHKWLFFKSQVEHMPPPYFKITSHINDVQVRMNKSRIWNGSSAESGVIKKVLKKDEVIDKKH